MFFTKFHIPVNTPFGCSTGIGFSMATIGSSEIKDIVTGGSHINVVPILIC